MKKKVIWAVIILIVIVLMLIVIANIIVVSKSKSYIYKDVEDVPARKVGLVLGTSKYLSDGSQNYYFKYRIDAAAELYKAGKVKFLVVSGDNHKKGYNEPQQMKDDLIEAGVPEEVIYLDYAGFRTLDSVVRMDKIFGQTEFTIVSQGFHNERAVFIAQGLGLETVAYNAKDVTLNAGFKTQLREVFARVKVFIDFMIHKQPKFLGEPIKIE